MVRIAAISLLALNWIYLLAHTIASSGTPLANGVASLRFVPHEQRVHAN